MARVKETVWQADFGFGAVRPEAVERDDTALIERSLKESQNTIVLATGQIEIRPGTLYVADTKAKTGIEVDLGSGRIYDLHLVPEGVLLYTEAGVVEYSNLIAPWTAITNKFGTFAFDDIAFWVVPDPDNSAILIGSKLFPPQALLRGPTGVWTFGTLNFATSLAGAILQPYFPYYPGVTIQPSARTGTITVTASQAIFTAAHAGLSLRYVGREIRLTTMASATVFNATVIEELPPTYNITVAAISGYQLGDAVEHSLLGGQGVVTAISGVIVTVLATSSYDGFSATATPKLVAPNASQVISLVATTAPAATYLWDVQMQSAVHGYAGWGARHTGRLFLCDYPGAPLSFAVSVSGDISDFTQGTDDGDGFVETIGSDRGGVLRYIISAEDLIFMTSRGLYYQQTRDGSVITPKSIAPISFSRIGCAGIEPVVIDDGAIFVDAVGGQIYGALLAGDAYRSWSARQMTPFHPHLVKTPIRLGATSSGHERPEQFIYAINSDGTAAICQWNRDENLISWRPWVTDGAFVAIYQAFGKTHAVVDRQIAETDRRVFERFEYGIVMDCVAAVSISNTALTGSAGADFFAGVTRFATHLIGHTSAIYFEGWDMGDLQINGAGLPIDQNGEIIFYPEYEGISQVGLPFVMRIIPWARRSVRTQRGLRTVKRLIETYVTVQDSSQVEVGGTLYGAYRANEDLGAPPPLRSDQFRVVHLGGDAYEAVTILKDRPGPFRLLKLGYRVVI